jgi:excisionase family DNA binding protein
MQEMNAQHPPSSADCETFETAKTIARLLAVSQRVVYLWYAKGLIPGYRINTTVRFLKSEVLNAIRK